jgi:hypothetical protein
VIITQFSGVFKGCTRLSWNGGSMQECRVCGLLFLGGGACPSCGSQVAVDVNVDDIVMDDESIPGLEEIADAIGDTVDDEHKDEVLPFGLGAKAEVIESSLPFGVGSFTSEVTEVAIPFTDDDQQEDTDESPGDEQDVVSESEINTQEVQDQSEPVGGLNIEDNSTTEETQPTVESKGFEVVTSDENEIDEPDIVLGDDEIEKQHIFESNEADGSNEIVEPVQVIADEVPDMWRIDAADVDMDAIYAQEDEIVEVSFENDLDSGDIQVSFDDFHHSPVEESMASDDDAPGLHPARALPVDSSGQPEIQSMVSSAFEYMANSSWMQAAQILSNASTNRQNDPAILNNLGLALLQSALEMDSNGDPMSSSQYEASIMALRQGAKVDPNNNTILLNLSHALLVSGRAEKALNVINVLRGREMNNVEVENVLGACLIQLGRDDEAESILRPFASDSVVSANLALI